MEGKAFLLRPDIPKERMPRQLAPEELGGQLKEPLRTFAQEAGLVMRRSTITPYALYALEATEHAQQQGKFDAFHLAAYKAYWEEGKNLGDLKVIEELAIGSGLDWPELAEKLESGYYRDAVLAQYREAINLGIRGIPAFLIGNQMFTGAQPYEIFELAYARAGGSTLPEPPGIPPYKGGTQEG